MEFHPKGHTDDELRDDLAIHMTRLKFLMNLHDAQKSNAALAEPRVFHLFGHLPIEIRLVIWNESLPGPRVVNLLPRRLIEWRIKRHTSESIESHGDDSGMTDEIKENKAFRGVKTLTLISQCYSMNDFMEDNSSVSFIEAVEVDNAIDLYKSCEPDCASHLGESLYLPQVSPHRRYDLTTLDTALLVDYMSPGEGQRVWEMPKIDYKVAITLRYRDALEEARSPYTAWMERIEDGFARILEMEAQEGYEDSEDEHLMAAT